MNVARFFKRPSYSTTGSVKFLVVHGLVERQRGESSFPPRNFFVVRQLVEGRGESCHNFLRHLVRCPVHIILLSNGERRHCFPVNVLKSAGLLKAEVTATITIFFTKQLRNPVHVELLNK